jgi:ubiquitin-conjugating enzyme E2 J2
MLTPSGRFQTDKRICFSMSDFHPGSVRLTPYSLFSSDIRLYQWNPAWSVATMYGGKLLLRIYLGYLTRGCRLTGLLSFMLSDEMTTGGLSSSIYDKRILAAKSHTWNISQKRFKDVFPDVCHCPEVLCRVVYIFYVLYQHCAPSMKNLPNMGEKELGKPDEASTTSLPINVNGTDTSTSRLTSAFTLPTPNPVPLPAPKLNGNASLPQTPAPVANGHGLLGTWAAGWRNVIWEKWRWGALIALAVVVSRLSS